MGDFFWQTHGLQFECSISKQKSNIQKHDIDLVFASKAFFDPDAITSFDATHSLSEERFTLIGLGDAYRLLFIAYIIRHGRIRIISARKANKQEHRQYERNK